MKMLKRRRQIVGAAGCHSYLNFGSIISVPTCKSHLGCFSSAVHCGWPSKPTLLRRCNFFISNFLHVLSLSLSISVSFDVSHTSPQYQDDHGHTFLVAFSVELTLVSAILFTLGSVYFVYLSYPEEMQRMAVLLSHEDVSKLTFIERYFTGRWFLFEYHSFSFM
jgi:hypothetical protein